MASCAVVKVPLPFNKYSCILFSFVSIVCHFSNLTAFNSKTICRRRQFDPTEMAYSAYSFFIDTTHLFNWISFTMHAMRNMLQCNFDHFTVIQRTTER